MKLSVIQLEIFLWEDFAVKLSVLSNTLSALMCLIIVIHHTMRLLPVLFVYFCIITSLWSIIIDISKAMPCQPQCNVMLEIALVLCRNSAKFKYFKLYHV